MNKIVDYLTGATIAVILFLIIGGAYGTVEYFNQKIKDNEPIENWFKVEQVYIPDMNSHTDPVIVYDRTISKAFDTNWDVQVEKLTSTGIFAYCSGSGISHPTPEKVIPAEGVTLSWLVGKSCDLTAGKYRVEATWVIHREGYKDVTYSYISNVFEVK